MKPAPDLFNFEGFAVKKDAGNLFFLEFSGYETRNQSTINLIKESDTLYKIPNFDWTVIHTGDYLDENIQKAPLQHIHISNHSYPLLSYSTSKRNYDATVPDFVFDHWMQTGLYDYERTRIELLTSNLQPKRNILGWRGALTHWSRSILVAMDDKVDFDCELINWDRKNPDKLTATNFISLEDQVSNWRYLIDIQGNGYSGRLKLLLSSRRVVFIQDRLHHEFFFKDLVPWQHFVPVKEDLSDLKDNLKFIKNNPDLELKIIENSTIFSKKFLTRGNAFLRWSLVLSKLGSNPPLLQGR